MIKNKILISFIIYLIILSFPSMGTPRGKKTPKNIYHKGWTDFNKNGVMDVYENPKAKLQERIDDLIHQMTMEEKTVQMVTLYGVGRVLKDTLPTPEWKSEIWKDGIGSIDEHINGFKGWGKSSILDKYCWPASDHAWAINQVQKFFVEETRLGIPVDFTNEGIRGVENYMATNFPTQLGIGQTWDRKLVNKIGQITGMEARALGYTNVYAPILDVGRDQRWGRMEEVYGESPFLVAEMGISMAKGMQHNHQIAATAKHFAIYSANKGAREGLARVDPQISPRETENIHLYPFKRVIKEANLLGVMSSYNDYDGMPIQSSHYYLTQKLRKEYGFKGYVVSDSDAVIYLYNKHKTAKDYKEAVRQSVEAGLNMRCTFRSPKSFVQPLRELVKEGAISEETINQRVADILRVKFMVGLFDHPYVENIKKSDQIVNSREHKNIALRVSQESLVLLKNQDDLLPLDRTKIKRIAICGPNANVADYALTHYGPLAVDVTTVLEGINNKVGKNIEVTYSKGCDLVDAQWPDSELYPLPLNPEEQQQITLAQNNAKNADVAIVVVGGSQRTCGENKSRTSLNLPGKQRELIQAIQKTGTPTIVVVISGRPLTINWTAQNVPAIIQAFYPGSQGGTAIADVLFGDYNPGGKLTVTIPKTVGQLPYNFPVKPNAQLDAWGQSGINGKRARVNGSLYPFGHGLSYTTFKYSNLSISPKVITPKQKVKVSMDITNTGEREGDEVVQLYIRDIVSTVTTYEKNLRGFDRVHLKKGETKRVTFQLNPDDLSLLDKDMRRIVEPGDFKVMIGSSSEKTLLEGIFTVADINHIKQIKTKVNKLTQKAKYIHSDRGQNYLINLLDKDENTGWETDQPHTTIDLELKEKAQPNNISILWRQGNKHQYEFEIQLSGGGGQFITVFKGKSSGLKKGLENYKFKGFPATDLRIICNGNSKNHKTAIQEILLSEFKGQ